MAGMTTGWCAGLSSTLDQTAEHVDKRTDGQGIDTVENVLPASTVNF
jgi:hypothetical protein